MKRSRERNHRRTWCWLPPPESRSAICVRHHGRLGGGDRRKQGLPKRLRGSCRRWRSSSHVRSIGRWLPIDKVISCCPTKGLAVSVARTSIMRQRARMALGRKMASVPPPVSFMIVLVTMMISSAELASSLMTKWTICRRLASLFWKSFEIPKKRVVASLVGKDSPV